MTDPTPIAHPPETLEGWYVLHQLFRVERGMAREWAGERLEEFKDSMRACLERLASPGDGWSAVVQLVGSEADVMLVHFRPTLDAVGEAQRAVASEPFADFLEPVYSFLSVTEAGLYHITAELAREAAARGGAVGDEPYVKELAERAARERASAHVRRRLYPALPADMPWVCFYPMSKRRVPEQNWYALPLDERSRLMYAHGLTGRRYAGRIVQVISGAIGFDAWEWGVTLFARDPLDFKKIVTDMRFDEVSAKYAEFGDFHVGRTIAPDQWLESIVA
jgi:hydrogen peroxide-dependent heme synthase